MKTLTLILSLATATLMAQGPLVPPGPPGATGKSLQEIFDKAEVLDGKAEKRTPVNATTAPGGSISGVAYQHVIGTSGSYYLTGNIDVSGDSGIYISAPNVTLDLNGMILTQNGSAGATAGIRAGKPGAKISNGSVRHFFQGIDVPVGAAGASIDALRIDNCANGIQAYAARVAGCIVTGCNGTYGVITRSSTVSDCVVRDCNAVGSFFTAFYIQEGSIVRGCTASAVSSATSGGEGFFIVGSTATACSSSNIRGNRANGFVAQDGQLDSCVSDGTFGTTTSSAGFSLERSSATGCFSSNNGDAATVANGFILVAASSVTSCRGSSFRDHAFRVSGTQNSIRNSAGTASQTTPGASAFYVGSNFNRIESCTSTAGDHGYRIAGGGNILLGNTAFGSATSNYEIQSGNHYGQIVSLSGGAAMSGGSAPSTLGTTDPHANFSR